MKSAEVVKEKEAGTVLPLMEAFYTLQGEGAFQGQAAYFIRLAGCDVGCVWCDVKESWDGAAYPQVSVEEMVEKASVYPSRMAVITGGEPAIHSLDYLCKKLHAKGFRTHIETSGAHSLSGSLDWVCLSPKKFQAPLPEVCNTANELKVIIYNKSDFQWAEEYAAKVAAGCQLFLQPEWSRADKMTPLIIDYIKAHPQWQVSLQIHKYMNIP